MPPFVCIRVRGHSRACSLARMVRGRHSPKSARQQRKSPVVVRASVKRRLVDTNLIVRYLVQDHEKDARAARSLFDACDRGEVLIVVLPAVLAECVFVLESFYEHPRGEIVAAAGSSPARVLRSKGFGLTSTHWTTIEKRRRRRKLTWSVPSFSMQTISCPWCGHDWSHEIPGQLLQV